MSPRYRRAWFVVFLIPLCAGTLLVLLFWQMAQPVQARARPATLGEHPSPSPAARSATLSTTLAIIVDDFWPQPDQDNSVYFYNRLGGDRGALNLSQLSFGLGAVTATIAPGRSWGGMWNSLNHVNIENEPVDFAAVLRPQILPAYQSEITGVSVHIRSSTAGRRFRLELKGPVSPFVWSREILLTGGPETLRADLPPLGDRQELVWVLDGASAGDSVVVDHITLTATTSITDPATAAFVWSYGLLLNNYDPATGLVRDKARYPSGDFDAVQATGSLAAATAQAHQLGIVDHSDAIQIVTQISDTLLLEVPQYHGLWPHWVEITPGGTLTIPANTEWSSVDTAIAALGLLTAQQALGLDTGGTRAFIQGIDWADLLQPGIGLSHGYSDTGTLLASTWDTFGGESWLVELLYVASTTSPDLPLAYPNPPTANGSGFIDELAWLFLPPPTASDVWGSDWNSYRDQAILTQTTYFAENYPGSCLDQLSLFGLSAAEVPLPSAVATDDIYQPFGMGGQFAGPNDGSALLGAPVAVPHYTAMIAGRSLTASLQMWSWLMREGVFSPLTNVESLLFPAGAPCDGSGMRWNGLKGSWNLALQALGWGNTLAKRSGQIPILWQAAMADSFLHGGYDQLVLSCATPVAPAVATAIEGDGVALAWPLEEGTIHFDVWRSDAPYFAPGGNATHLVMAWGQSSYVDAGVLGDPAVHHFYRVQGNNTCGNEALSAPVGEVEFALTPGS